MSKKAKDGVTEEVKEEAVLTSQNQLKKFLNANKDSHYNFEPSIEYKVSSGSLLLDYFLDGGLTTGLHRFCGINEGGKAQPLSEPVLTASGWVPIGQLKMGDKILNSKGQEQEVLGVYPQGILPVYEVFFDDGAKTKCCAEHLWETSTVQERQRGAKSVRSTYDIKATLRANKRLNHRVRKVKILEFPQKDFGGEDLFVAGSNLAKSPDPLKRVDEKYKLASIEQRLVFLAGLLTQNSQVKEKKDHSVMQYDCPSIEFRQDVLDIVRSLGGLTQIFSVENVHSLTFCLPKEVSGYTLNSKLHLVIYDKEEKFFHYIQKVSRVVKEECVCIKVSSPDCLYITRDFILTHNTSAALQFMKNFLDKPKKRKGFYVKAEGRLSKEMIERSGVKFVFSHEEWVEGTCFVFESNIHETVFDAFRELIGTNEEKIQYFFLLDSVDGLIRKGDLDKTFEESQKVAGGAVIAADLMKRVSIALQKRGHIAIFISQVRADIKLDPYSKAPVRQTSATGGNALLHFANWIFEFENRWKGDLILQDMNSPYDEQKNPYLGHFVKIVVKKSPSEKTNCVIRYPIRYGRKNGTSNWIEKEIYDFLLMWEIAVKKGAWISFDEDFLNTVKEAGFPDFPATIQGANKFEQLVNENEKLKQFFFTYISNNLLHLGDGISITES